MPNPITYGLEDCCWSGVTYCVFNEPPTLSAEFNVTLLKLATLLVLASISAVVVVVVVVVDVVDEVEDVGGGRAKLVGACVGPIVTFNKVGDAVGSTEGAEDPVGCDVGLIGDKVISTVGAAVGLTGDPVGELDGVEVGDKETLAAVGAHVGETVGALDGAGVPVGATLGVKVSKKNVGAEVF